MNLRIIQVCRKPGINFSIEHVFDTINRELEKRCLIQKRCLPYAYVRPYGLLRNLLFALFKCNTITHIVGEIHYAALAIRYKTIITVHDLSFIDLNSGWKRCFFYWLWYYFPLKKAIHVTCISYKVRDDILRDFPFVRDKISVIYNPLDPRFTYSYKKFDTIRPVILHIGTASNKNLERVIEALKSIDCELRVIGKKRMEYVALLNESGINYQYKSNLTDEEIIEEYRQADIISFPSLYEGFGMPIVEGQAVGRVVLASDIEPLLDVAGPNGACFVNPYSVNSIRSGLKKIIEDEDFRNSLLKAGRQNVARFEPSIIAEQYFDLYKTFS